MSQVTNLSSSYQSRLVGVCLRELKSVKGPQTQTIEATFSCVLWHRCNFLFPFYCFLHCLVCMKPPLDDFWRGFTVVATANWTETSVTNKWSELENLTSLFTRTGTKSVFSQSVTSEIKAMTAGMSFKQLFRFLDLTFKYLIVSNQAVKQPVRAVKMFN